MVAEIRAKVERARAAADDAAAAAGPGSGTRTERVSRAPRVLIAGSLIAHHGSDPPHHSAHPGVGAIAAADPHAADRPEDPQRDPGRDPGASARLPEAKAPMRATATAHVDVTA